MSIDAELDAAEKDIRELESLKARLAAAVAELEEVDRKADQLLARIKKAQANG